MSDRIHVYGVDPGTTHSALVCVDVGSRTIVARATEPNDVLLNILVTDWLEAPPNDATKILVVEQIEAMGMAVGRETFETVWYAGRFHQAWQGRAERMTRRAVKLHLCGTMRAKDANIRQALLDRYGGSTAIGTKKDPGRLYGVRAHEFAALAVAVTFIDTQLGGTQHDRGTELVSARVRGTERL